MTRKIVSTLLVLGMGAGAGAAYGQSAAGNSAVGNPAGSSSSVGNPVGGNSGDQPTIGELQAQIKNLQTQVNAVQTSQQEQEADRLATIKAVLADADQQTELVSGYDPNVGFVLRSADGAFSLHPGIVLDVRNMTSYREDTPLKSGEAPKAGYDTQNGFDITRARLTFDGNFTKDINYFVQFSADQGAPASLLDAYWTYHLGDTPFGVKVGQFKDPLFHERNLSEANLLTVDRSLVEALLGGGQTSRVQGAALVYDKDRFRGQLVIDDGYDSINTKFFDAGGNASGVAGGAGVTPTNFGTSGRAEYLAIGDRSAKFNPFKEYDGGFTALGDTQDILVLGGGYDYSQAGDNNIFFHTVDAQYDTASGFSAYGAYLGTYRNLHSSQGVTAATTTTPAGPAVAPGNYYDPGFLVQAAYLVTPNIEPFARYDYTYLDGASVAAFGLNKNDAQEVTVGANYYIYKQHAKITLDGSWLPDGSPVDSDALGVLQNSGHQEFVVRVQFQLAI